jgi:phage tail sheath gpL-like
MPKFLVAFNVTDPNPIVSGDVRGSMKRLENICKRIARGAYGSAVSVDSRVDGVKATGTITMASSSGTVGAIINGVTVSVAWATSDTNSASLLAAAINASSNALVSGFVSATSAAGVVTITADLPGKAGNAITLAATGTNVTASGARLTGGTETRVNVSL